MTVPTLYVTNWPSPDLHGPGRKLNIMVKPRKWELGDGNVPLCTPRPVNFQAYKEGVIDATAYLGLVRVGVEQSRMNKPGDLMMINRGEWGQVQDGDSLLCACSKEVAAKGLCHRVVVAHALAKLGWRIILDGVEVSS